MSVLTAHLRKDLRASRTGMIALLTLVAVCIGVAPLLLPRYLLASSDLVLSFTIGSMLVVAIGVAPDLVQSEKDKIGLQLLGRLANGVSTAFLSKCTLLLAGMGALAVLVYAIMSLVSSHYATTETVVEDPLLVAKVACAFGLVFCLGVLILGVASWLPRAYVSLIATSFLIAFVVLPAALVVSLTYGRLIPTLTWGPVLLAASAFSLAIGWVSFARGRRFGRGPWSAAWRGFLVVAVAQVSLFAWVGGKCLDWGRFDLNPSIVIQNGVLGANEKHLYLTVDESDDYGARFAIIVDIDDGSYRAVQGVGTNFGGMEIPGGLPWWVNWRVRRTQPLLGLFHAYGDLGKTSYFDGRDASELIHEGKILSEEKLSSFLEFNREARRSMSPIRTADGLPVWFEDGHLLVRNADGVDEELVAGPKFEPWDACGFGLIPASGGKVYDLVRRRMYQRSSMPADINWVWVLSKGWLVSIYLQPDPGVDGEAFRRRRQWQLLDPDDPESAVPAPGMKIGDQIQAVLDDGQVLVGHTRKKLSSFYRVNTETGSRVSLAISGLDGPYAVSGVWPLGYRAPLRGPRGERLFRLSFRAKGERVVGFVTLAPSADCYSQFIEARRFVGWQDDGHLILLKDNQVVRANPDTGQSTVVWPLQKGDR